MLSDNFMFHWCFGWGVGTDCCYDLYLSWVMYGCIILLPAIVKLYRGVQFY